MSHPRGDVEDPKHADGVRQATGLRNLPLHDAAQYQVWLEIVQIALDLPAWMPGRL